MHNKCHMLELSWNYPTIPGLWKKMSSMKLVPVDKRLGYHWSTGSLSNSQSFVKSAAGIREVLKCFIQLRWCWSSSIFNEDIKDKWHSQFKHNPFGIHSSEYSDNLSITPPSSNISTSVTSGLLTLLQCSQSKYAMPMSKGLGPEITSWLTRPTGFIPWEWWAGGDFFFFPLKLERETLSFLSDEGVLRAWPITAGNHVPPFTLRVWKNKAGTQGKSYSNYLLNTYYSRS